MDNVKGFVSPVVWGWFKQTYAAQRHAETALPSQPVASAATRELFNSAVLPLSTRLSYKAKYTGYALLLTASKAVDFFLGALYGVFAIPIHCSWQVIKSSYSIGKVTLTNTLWGYTGVAATVLELYYGPSKESRLTPYAENVKYLGKSAEVIRCCIHGALNPARLRHIELNFINANSQGSFTLGMGLVNSLFWKTLEELLGTMKQLPSPANAEEAKLTLIARLQLGCWAGTTYLIRSVERTAAFYLAAAHIVTLGYLGEGVDKLAQTKLGRRISQLIGVNSFDVLLNRELRETQAFKTSEQITEWRWITQHIQTIARSLRMLVFSPFYLIAKAFKYVWGTLSTLPTVTYTSLFKCTPLLISGGEAQKLPVETYRALEQWGLDPIFAALAKARNLDMQVNIQKASQKSS